MIKAKIIDVLERVVILAVALGAFWFWSNYQIEKRVQAECALQHSNKEIEVMEVQKREAQNVETKKSIIYSKPNANRDSLLNKMRAGQL